MPDGMILANPVNFNVGACGGTLTGTPGAGSFTFQGGRLRAGQSCTLTLSATMSANGNLTNTIPAGAVTTTNGLINPDPAEATLTNLPGVSISKHFQANPIPVDSSSALVITIQNTGNIPLVGMGFRDTLPAGLTIAGNPAPAPVNNCGGTLTAEPGTSLIQLTNGMLDGTSSCSMIVHITGDSRGSYQNIIPPGSLETDENVTNSAPATDTLVIVGKGNNGGGGGKPPETGGNGFLIPVTGFAPAKITELNIASRPRYDATSLVIEIPVLKIKTAIVGVEATRGKWDVSWLQDQVGWLSGTAYPTRVGNSLLTAHAVGADGKPALFSGLKYLGVGEFIYVYDAGYRYTYQVVSNDLVHPHDTRVMKREVEPYLTLITCDQYDEKTESYLRRIAVRAVLVDVRAIRE
jgi:LPXTG-site transpeptidase (sortase) family protein